MGFVRSLTWWVWGCTCLVSYISFGITIWLSIYKLDFCASPRYWRTSSQNWQQIWLTGHLIILWLFAKIILVKYFLFPIPYVYQFQFIIITIYKIMLPIETKFICQFVKINIFDLLLLDIPQIQMIHIILSHYFTSYQ